MMVRSYISHIKAKATKLVLLNANLTCCTFVRQRQNMWKYCLGNKSRTQFREIFPETKKERKKKFIISSTNKPKAVVNA